MGRTNLVLALILMLSALSLVTARYQARQLFMQNEQFKSQARELDIDWRRLQIERAEWSRNARVDQLAREELKMVPIVPERTIYIRGNMP
ncbi:MAG: cell division protein FtsL [Burkholderiaceae bacterium]|jgi:cell division protein FtsL|nr:cell division protein FtsL [Burkholderiaceae bacterium]